MDKTSRILSHLFSLAILIWLLFWVGGCAKVPPSHRQFPLKGEIKIPDIAPSQQPYVVGGHLYIPMKYLVLGWTQTGIASWYGLSFHNRFTASGERYNMYSYTAAHKTLPLGTIVKVTNLKNGKSIVVQINDRGPFVANRIIDLSYSAAKALGLDKEGVGKVKLTIIGYRPPKKVSSLVSAIGITSTGFTGLSSLERLYANLERKAEEESILKRLGRKLAEVVKSFIHWVKEKIHQGKESEVKKINKPEKSPKLKPKATPSPSSVKSSRPSSTPSLKSPPKTGQIHLQVATYRYLKNAERLAARLRKKGYNTRVVRKRGYYRVVVDLPNREAVQKFELKEHIRGVKVDY